MNKKLILTIIVTTIIAVSAVFYAVVYISPWSIMYLYGQFCVPEPAEPSITEESFPFTLDYELNGKKKVIEDTMICKYTGSEWYGTSDEKSRTWGMKLKSGKDAVVLWEGKNKRGEQQRIVWGVDPAYFMGDGDDVKKYELPDKEYFFYPGMTEEEYYNTYIELETKESDGLIDEESLGKRKLLEKYGIKILNWECALPIENSFQ